MGFAPHSESTKPAPEMGGELMAMLGEGELEWWAILLIVIAASGGLAFIIWLIVISSTRGKAKDELIFILHN